MDYKKFIGKKVEVKFLDHEQESNVDIKHACIEKSLEVTIYGIMNCDNKDYVVISSWVCPEANDVYRVLKSCIKGIRVLK